MRGLNPAQVEAYIDFLHANIERAKKQYDELRLQQWREVPAAFADGEACGYETALYQLKKLLEGSSAGDEDILGFQA